MNLNPNKLVTRGLLATALSVGAAACGGSTEKSEPYCTFSTETTTVTIPRDGGRNHALLQIAGVDYGTCLDSAAQAVQELNPGINLSAPRYDQGPINIPVSAEFHEG